MVRFKQLIDELEVLFPDDWWIASWRESAQLFPEGFPEIQVYQKAISTLDEESWIVLSERSCLAFNEPRTSRGKNHFFNLLNEALAYEFLTESGFSNVRFLKADKKTKRPDISFDLNGAEQYCEVKTIGISDVELARFASEEVFDTSIYLELTQSFLEKLRSVIKVAETQLEAASGHGLIYLVIHFDDFALDYFKTYQCQIEEFLAKEYPCRAIIVRVGLDRPHYIKNHISQ